MEVLFATLLARLLPSVSGIPQEAIAAGIKALNAANLAAAASGEPVIIAIGNVSDPSACQ